MQPGPVGADAALCASLLERLNNTLSGRPMRFMEVCGTHTSAIFQSGLRSLLPANITHLSGPGCPVCVTHEREVALFLELAKQKNIIIATFGDLLRVPGPKGQSLKHLQAAGAHIRIVYSPLAALNLAQENPDSEVVFLGVGFETTAPTVAATILAAARQGLDNFSVLSMHKLVAPALRLLATDEKSRIDAFMLPGHVATITGSEPFRFLSACFAMPAAISGFESIDLLLALNELATQFVSKKMSVANCYPRAVSDSGNARAREIMDKVFKPVSTLWRGLEAIDQSGLGIRKEYARHDAMRKFALVWPDVAPLPGCSCGSILKGQLSPPECPLFGKKCSPLHPLGPCMVSTEGSCAAYYKYGVN